MARVALKGCAGTRNLVPRALSYPPFSRSVGRVGENPGNEVGGPARTKGVMGRGEKGSSFPSSPWPLSCFSLVSRARVFPNPHLTLGRPVKEADTKSFVSWGKAFHKFLEIFQKVSRNFSKSCSKIVKKKNNQKLLFALTKVAQKLLKKTKTSFGLMLKNANCTTKVRFLSIFVQFCGVTSVAK